MTNRIAIWLALSILIAGALDLAMGWEAHVFLLRKLIDTIHWLAIWR